MTVTVSHITKKFDENTVLRDVSFDIPAGKITCLTGESGCGKTTLLRVIAGLIKADSGTVEGVPAKVSFVFQEDRFSESFSAVSNIRMITGRLLSEAEIKRHLAALGLEDYAKKPVSEFSGGMKRRLSVIAAVCFGGDLFLLDEPFKGLDDDWKRKTMDYLRENTAGKTVFCVTHDVREADYLGAELIRFEK